MITNPQNIFELVQNDIATKLMTLPIFTGIKMPDDTPENPRPFQILTEDEGDPEMLFTAMIARAGLAVIVQSPTGKIAAADGPTHLITFRPFVVAVSISEAMLFNRSDLGTKVRLMPATSAVISALHGFYVPSLGAKLVATRLLKDKDTNPEDQALVASRIVTFETEVRLKTATLTT
jgi:hypothetical protein